VPGRCTLTASRFTFAAARHVVVDMAQILHTPPIPGVNRLGASEWTQLRERLAAAGFSLKNATASVQKLAKLRATYEPFVSALAELIQVSMPPWIPPEVALDNWQTITWDERFPCMRQTLK